jgi:hypothetical protein
VGQENVACAGSTEAGRVEPVVGHDSDLMALFRRVEEAYGEQPVLIRRVRPKIEQTSVVLSPRLDYA